MAADGGDPRSRIAKIRRRSISVTGLFVTTVLLTITAPFWLTAAIVVDVVRFRRRVPLARLLAFGVCWCWIESGGVMRAFGLWATGRVGDQDAHYRLMGWWAGALIRALSATTGVAPRIEGGEALDGGNAIVLARHASLGRLAPVGVGDPDPSRAVPALCAQEGAAVRSLPRCRRASRARITSSIATPMMPTRSSTRSGRWRRESAPTSWR